MLVVVVILVSQLIIEPWLTFGIKRSLPLFYEIPLCSPFVSANNRHVVQLAETSPGACELRNEAKARVAAGSGDELDIMLRLDDGFEAGKIYLPIVVIGTAQYALVSFSVVDAQRKPLQDEMTLQLGPDEGRFPWGDQVNEDTSAEGLVEDLVEDLGEDLLEEVAETVGDLFESVGEDIGDSLQDLIDIEDVPSMSEEEEEKAEEAEEKAEEEAERIEEVLEEKQEAEVEEEEAEREEAEEAGYLVGISIRKHYYELADRFKAQAARFNYYLPDRMSADEHVPGSFSEDGGLTTKDSPPYFYGRKAVKAHAELEVATIDHYTERMSSDVFTKIPCHTKKQRRYAPNCANVSVYQLPVFADRYELVPAAAVVTPEETWRWPLQLRLPEARVYTNESLPNSTLSMDSVPLLITFAPLSWDPQTAFSEEDDDETLSSSDGLPAMLPVIVVFVMVSATLSVVCDCRQCGRWPCTARQHQAGREDTSRQRRASRETWSSRETSRQSAASEHAYTSRYGHRRAHSHGDQMYGRSGFGGARRGPEGSGLGVYDRQQGRELV